MAGIALDLIEITVPRGRRVRQRVGIVHEVRALPGVDIGVVDAIPVATPTRTLIDLAAVLHPEELEEALDDALRRRLTTIPRLRWRLRELARPGRAGIVVIRRIVDARSPSAAIPASVLETRLLRLIRSAGLPEPACQYRITDEGRLIAIVDLAYPDAMVAIEADGHRWHSSRPAWQHDLARRNELTRRGWRVIHVTWDDVERRPHHVAATISEALSLS